MKLVVRLLLLPLKFFWRIILLSKKVLHFLFSPVFLLPVTVILFSIFYYLQPKMKEDERLWIIFCLLVLLFFTLAHVASWLEKKLSLFGSVFSLVIFACMCVSGFIIDKIYGYKFSETILFIFISLLYLGVWGIVFTVFRFLMHPKKTLFVPFRKSISILKVQIQSIRKFPVLKLVLPVIIIVQCACIALLMLRVNRLEDQVGIKSLLCSEQSSIDQTKKAIVRIAATKGEGTGFVIHPEGVIVTNAHVIGDDIAPKIIFPDYTFAAARVIARYKDEDIAVLQVDKKDMQYIRLSYDRTLQPREELFIVGYPLGTSVRGESTVARTQFIAKRTFKDDPMSYVQMSSGIDSGFSGSPVINACGDVVGVASNSTNASSLAISSKSVVSLINTPDEYSEIGQLHEEQRDFKEAFDSPSEAVTAFYDAIRARHFRLSYDLLSKERINGVSFDDFVKGYAKTLDVAVLNIKADKETPEKVTVNLRAMDLVGQDIIPTYYEGVWTVVKEDDAWKLGASNIKKINEEPWWAWWD